MAYTTESLTNGIQKCKDNIKIFEEAIEKENNSIREFRGMIRKMEELEENKKEALSHVEIEE